LSREPKGKGRALLQILISRDFEIGNLLRLQRTTTEDVASSTEYRSARYVGSSSRGSQNRLALEVSLMLLLGRSVPLPFA
jgi:hypothetical protein